jgi:hypothetical protein
VTHDESLAIGGNALALEAAKRTRWLCETNSFDFLSEGFFFTTTFFFILSSYPGIHAHQVLTHHTIHNASKVRDVPGQTNASPSRRQPSRIASLMASPRTASEEVLLTLTDFAGQLQSTLERLVGHFD